MDILPFIFEGQDFEKVMSLNYSVNVAASGHGNALRSLEKFEVMDGDSVVLDSKSLKLKENIHQGYLERMMAVLEFVVLGLGLGASRHAECFRMEAFRFSFRTIDEQVLFYTKSDKVYSILSKSGKLIEHLLPQSISHFILLHFWVVFESGAFDGLTDPNLTVNRPVVPNLKKRDYEMKDLAKEIFHLPQVPGDRQLRQFFTSLTNYLFNDNDEPFTFEEMVVADPETSERSQHSAGTHRRIYPSIFSPDGTQMKIESKSACLESKRQRYHEAIGETPRNRKPVQAKRSEIIPESAMEESLIHLYGPGSTFLSKYQRDAVMACANGRKHMFVGLPCGTGKSALWQVSAYTRWRLDYSRKMTLVVVPYKFLSACHYEAMGKLVANNLGFRVDCLQRVEVDDSERVGDLFGAEDFPDILFVTVDCLSDLLQHHRGLLRDFGRKKLLNSIIVDEIHSVFLEAKFRINFDVLQKIILLAAPVILMSGTLPSSMAARCFKWMGIHHFEEVIQPGVLGQVGFQLKIIQDPRSDSGMKTHAAMAASQFIKKKLQSSADVAIHVLVDTKGNAEDVQRQLQNLQEKSLVITSEVEMKEQE